MISAYMIIISVTLLNSCNETSVIEIKPAYITVDFQNTVPAKPNFSLKVMKFVDERTTEIVDTWYDQGIPQVYWIVGNDIGDIISDAIKEEIKRHGLIDVSGKPEIYLYGAIQIVKTTVVQKKPEYPLLRVRWSSC